LDLFCSLELRSRYRSNSQIARVLTEKWFAGQMYCPACDSGTFVPAPNNCPGIDFTCPKCALSAQLKSRRTALTNRIVDAGYDAMIRAIRSNQAPNLFLLRYSAAWSIIDLLLIPSFFFTESAIEKRTPLSSMARRAGWVGCNILLNNVPEDGRIPVVTEGVAANPSQVRDSYQRLQPFREIEISARGWTLDILNIVRKLGKKDVSLPEFYQFEGLLQGLHPNNKNVRPKIRQQLQVLRDLGYLGFEGGGHYRVLR
jgi:type II restriction enzyme